MDKKINILFLGGAKRVTMARMFERAAAERGLTARIFSYELSARVPIAVCATVIEGLRWADPDIYADLERVVEENSIRIIVPFVDPAVAVAARFAETHSGVFAPTSPHHLCDSMFDKVLAAELFERSMLPIPTTYSKGRPEFPLIAKPRTGSASKGIMIIRNATDFRKAVTPPGRFIIQEYIEDRKEYTVDCYVSRSGEICCVSPRLRLEITGGEVSRTVTVDSPDITKTSAGALRRLGLTGAVTLQYLRDRRDGRLLLMEINPRLGGGAVCTVYAGADIPGMIIDEAIGKEPRPQPSPETGVEIARYFEEAVFHNSDKKL